jgi:alanine dehydrogenase
VLVSAEALKSMAAGSVVVDMGASALGGNVEGSEPDETLVTENGITLIGAGSLPSTMPAAASAMYARNISALLLYMLKDGSLAIDRSDDLQAGVVVTHDGQVVHPALTDPAETEVAETEPAETEPAETELAGTAPAETAPADSAGGTARVDGSSH